MYPVDLHCHTTRSDGRDTPAELLQHARRLGMKILALTDHDIRPPRTILWEGEQRDIVAVAQGMGLTLIRGIEISCDTENEDVHIVGLGCDWTDSWFGEMERDTVRSKLEGYRRVVEALAGNSYPLTMEEVLGFAGIADNPDGLQKKHIFEAMEKKGYAKSWNDAKIYVQQHPELNFKRRKPDPADAIHAIHGAGGIAILAHPYLIEEQPVTPEGRTTRRRYIQGLIDAGLDGIEARYTYDKTSYRGTMTKEQIRAEVLERYPLPIISGGSDYHADYKTGTLKCREIGEAGLTEEEFYGTPRLAALVSDN